MKRKGVVKEEPNNPAKDNITKIGTVTITVEAHAIEATMFAIKDPKPPAAPTTNSTFRPIMQYGPPNGVMPPPPKPAAPATPSTSAAVPASPSKGLAKPSTQAVAAKPPTPGAKPATLAPGGADPIIVTLAEKASEDLHLRDLMKRVVVGDASAHELAHFQRIIDQITADYKKRGGQQGPSADRLIVDGRTVQYFADEVDAILGIVLKSNAKQKGADLIPPQGSDPLVILLVRKALDDAPLKSMVKRVAEKENIKFSDTTNLKVVLDKLKDLVPKDAPKPQPALPAQSPSSSTTRPQTAESVPTRAPGRKGSVASTPQTPTGNSQQALRSKGPPPNLKPDITGIVFEFHGGTGDRYLFPKFSILEYQAGGSQVLASFLLVRKGSKSEYGGDPALDYYQPITIRLQANSGTGKHLENLARVVAPQDEVKRYMDDIMSNMTRAEYILLAMRLHRHDEEDVARDREQQVA